LIQEKERSLAERSVILRLNGWKGKKTGVNSSTQEKERGKILLTPIGREGSLREQETDIV